MPPWKQLTYLIVSNSLNSTKCKTYSDIGQFSMCNAKDDLFLEFRPPEGVENLTFALVGQTHVLLV